MGETMRAPRDSQRQGLWRTIAVAGALLLSLTTSAVSGAAATQDVLGDRLECFRLRTQDTSWTASAHAGDVLDLMFSSSATPPFAGGASGVELLRGAAAEPSELCVPVLKDPARGPVGDAIDNALACYDLVDQRTPRTEVALADEFGGGTVVVREGTRKLCVPVTLR